MPNDKNMLLAKIHIAKKELGLDDETYRAVLQRVIGKSSCAKANAKQLTKVIEEFKSLGFKGQSNKKFRKSPIPAVKKVYALWGELQGLGAVETKDKTALDAFVKKYTGIDNANWLDDKSARKVIEILKKWIERVSE